MCYVKFLEEGKFLAPVQFHIYLADFLARHAMQFIPNIVHEDELFTFQAYQKAGKVLHLSESLYYYRIRENSIMTSQNWMRRFESYCVIVDVLWKEYREPVSKHTVSKEEAMALYFFLDRINYLMQGPYSEMEFSEREKCRNTYREMLGKYRELLRKMGYHADVRKSLLLQVRREAAELRYRRKGI